MIILLKLLLAHFIGDFVLQPSSWVVSKEQRKLRSPQLYYHLLVHAAAACILLWNEQGWLYGLLLIPVHGLVDVVKIYAQNPRSKTRWFVWDQLLHLASLFAIWSLLTHSVFHWAPFFNNPGVWIYLTALVFVTTVSSTLIRVLMSGWTNYLDDPKDHSLMNAGKYIGLLERSLAFIFILVGHWEAVGFLLTAKSVFRFGDLKEAQNRKLTEYVLIGTFLSFGIAIVTGILVTGLRSVLHF